MDAVSLAPTPTASPLPPAQSLSGTVELQFGDPLDVAVAGAATCTAQRTGEGTFAVVDIQTGEIGTVLGEPIRLFGQFFRTGDYLFVWHESEGTTGQYRGEAPATADGGLAGLSGLTSYLLHVSAEPPLGGSPGVREINVQLSWKCAADTPQ